MTLDEIWMLDPMVLYMLPWKWGIGKFHLEVDFSFVPGESVKAQIIHDHITPNFNKIVIYNKLEAFDDSTGGLILDTLVYKPGGYISLKDTRFSHHLVRLYLYSKKPI